jgi:hypothetical protein
VCVCVRRLAVIANLPQIRVFRRNGNNNYNYIHSDSSSMLTPFFFFKNAVIQNLIKYTYFLRRHQYRYTIYIFQIRILPPFSTLNYLARKIIIKMLTFQNQNYFLKYLNLSANENNSMITVLKNMTSN